MVWPRKPAPAGLHTERRWPVDGRVARAPVPLPCGGRCSPMRALAVPTVLLLVVAGMIAKVAFFEASPVPAAPLRPTEAITQVASPAPTAIPATAVPTSASLAEPPVCMTPLPSHVCRTALPLCPDVLTTPGVLCRWPPPAVHPH